LSLGSNDAKKRPWTGAFFMVGHPVDLPAIHTTVLAVIHWDGLFAFYFESFFQPLITIVHFNRKEQRGT
jgi:hypothetical protein